ncbi:hypothetical protein [Acidiphilium acidophilum]|uniref:hypothetical protein n=1 Tax=Acidiphilium acidophilum TaxID=76588 RepID=UPI002E8E6811|nr:hypothetical protein [Acidiphilium acidophilum]
MPDPVAPADLAALRRTAENPLARPSERVAARMALKALGEGPKRRGPIEAEDGAMILRVLVRAAGDA